MYSQNVLLLLHFTQQRLNQLQFQAKFHKPIKSLHIQFKDTHDSSRLAGCDIQQCQTNILKMLHLLITILFFVENV